MVQLSPIQTWHVSLTLIPSDFADNRDSIEKKILKQLKSN